MVHRLLLLLLLLFLIPDVNQGSIACEKPQGWRANNDNNNDNNDNSDDKQANEMLVHVAYSADATQWLGVFASIHSALRNAIEPNRLRFHVLLLDSETALFQRELACIFDSPLERAQVLVHTLPESLARLLNGI